MAKTVAQLRADFPEFESVSAYPDARIQFELDLAYGMLNAARWGNQLDVGAELYAAHNLVLGRRAELAAAAGGTPGEMTGPLASKSVGPLSKSYDTGSAAEEGAGQWNLTVYGARFIRLARMFGAGPVQVGVGSAPAYSQLAWPGPQN